MGGYMRECVGKTISGAGEGRGNKRSGSADPGEVPIAIGHNA